MMLSVRSRFVPTFVAGMLFAGVFVTQEIVQPSVIERVPAEYTAEARDAGLEGRVVLETIVRADGTPEVTRATRGMPMGLNTKAIESVEQWTFEPGTVDGVPTEMRLNIEVRFSLTEDGAGDAEEGPEPEEAPEIEP